MSINISSEAFHSNHLIPKKYSCDGENLSPPLAWSNLPVGTESIAIVCEDPDAPSGNFLHWLIFNIDPGVPGLPEGVTERSNMMGSAVQGRNGFGKTGYGGPCPPRGSTHRYFFRAYALDKMLNLGQASTRAVFEKAMEGHLLGTGELVGMYSR